MAAIIWRFHSSGVRKALCTASANGIPLYIQPRQQPSGTKHCSDSIVDARPHAIGTHKISAKNLPHNVIRAISAVCNSCHLAYMCILE
jgi:hypothetical protein